MVTISDSGQFLYTAGDYFQSLAAGQASSDAFTFTLHDQRGGETVATATLEVQGQNDSPITFPDEVDGAYEDEIFIGSGLLDNDEDIDGDRLVAFAKATWCQDTTETGVARSANGAVFDPKEVSLTTTSQLGVQVTIYPDGTFKYEPNGALDWLAEGETAIDTFQYWIHDSVSEAVGIAQVFIGTRAIDSPAPKSLQSAAGAATAPTPGGANDPPKAKDDGPYSTKYDTGFTIGMEQGLLRNDVDADRNETAFLQVDVTIPCIQSTHGASVTLRRDGSYDYDPATLSTSTKAALASGTDVVDHFTYRALDPHNALSDFATVTIVLKAKESPYHLALVAKTASPAQIDFPGTSLSTTYHTLGTGPSINNVGVVAFSGTVDYTDSSGKKQEGGNLFAYYPSTLNAPTSDYPIRALMSQALMLPLPKDAPNAPSQQFGSHVQINDKNDIIAWRNINAKVFIGSWQLGLLGMAIPLAESSQFPPAPLTYVEQWNADDYNGRAPIVNVPENRRWYSWTGGEAGVARALYGMGDANTISSGQIAIGDPLWRELCYSYLISIMPGLAGAAAGMSAAIAAQPKLLTMWFVDPTTARVWPSPFDPVCEFQQVYTGITLNNASESAYTATAGSLDAHDNFLVTALHQSQYLRWGYPVSTGTDIKQIVPKIADNGRIVFSVNSTLYSLDYSNDPQEPVVTIGADQGFEEIGPYPAVSDDGSLVVFTAKHLLFGEGVYVADPSTGAWAKIAGNSGDGILDPGETYADLNGNGIFEPNLGEIDRGPFRTIPVGTMNSSSPIDAHLAINKIDAAFGNASNRYQIAFMSEDVHETNSLYTLTFDFTPISASSSALPTLTCNYVQEAYVLGIGDIVPQVSTSPISQISLNDALNQHGELAFYVKASAGVEAILHTTAIGVDLDVDSNNDGAIDPNNDVSTGTDDPIEATDGQPGCVILANTYDKDHDGTPDFADFSNSQETFAKVILRIDHGSYINTDDVRMVFTYSGSDPRSLQTDSSGTPVPAPGYFRLWTKDGAAVRNPSTDYIQPSVPYKLSDLGFVQGKGEITLYAEGIEASYNVPQTLDVVLVSAPDATGQRHDLARDTAQISVDTFDLNIDSDNNNGLALPDHSQHEEEIEDAAGEPGKYIQVSNYEYQYAAASHDNEYYIDPNTGRRRDIPEGTLSVADNTLDRNISQIDVDGDGVPDDEDTNGVADAHFAKITLSVPIGVDLGKIYIRLKYNASDIRLWTVDADSARDDAHDVKDGGRLVKAGIEYTPRDLGFGDTPFAQVRRVTFYVEGFDAVSASNGDHDISAEFLDRGTSRVIGGDTIKVTLINCQLTMFVVRPYVYFGGTRRDYQLDTSGLRSAMSSMIYGLSGFDVDYHGQFAWEGHVFVNLRYDGPNGFSTNEGWREAWFGATGGDIGMGNGLRLVLGGAIVAGGVVDLPPDSYLPFWSDLGGGRDQNWQLIASYLGDFKSASVAVNDYAGNGLSNSLVLDHKWIVSLDRINLLRDMFLARNYEEYGLDIATTTGGCASAVGIALSNCGFGEAASWFVDVNWPVNRSEFVSCLATNTWPTIGVPLSFYDPGKVVEWISGQMGSGGPKDTFFLDDPVTTISSTASPVSASAPANSATSAVQSKQIALSEEVSTFLSGSADQAFFIALSADEPVANADSPVTSGLGVDREQVVEPRQVPSDAVTGVLERLSQQDVVPFTNQPATSDFPVNTTTENYQEQSAVAVRADGSFVVVWSSHSGAGGIYGKMFNADGSVAKDEFLISNITDGVQVYPDIAVDPTGGAFVVTWQNDSLPSGDDPGTSHVYARAFDKDGEAIGEQVLVSDGEGDHYSPSIAFAGSGDFVIAWDSFVALSYSKIFARHFTAANATSGAAFEVTGGATQLFPEVAAAPDSSFVVAWQTTDGQGSGIAARRYDASSNPLGNVLPVNTTTAGDQTAPALAVQPDGSFMVTWLSGTDLMAQLFTASGTTSGTELTVNGTGPVQAYTPSIAAASGGRYLIAWTDTTLAALGRMYNSDGTAPDAPFALSSAATGYQIVARGLTGGQFRGARGPG